MRRHLRDELRMKERIEQQDMVVDRVIDEIQSDPARFPYACNHIGSPAFAEATEHAFAALCTENSYPSPRQVADVVDRMVRQSLGAGDQQTQLETIKL